MHKFLTKTRDDIGRWHKVVKGLENGQS